MSLTDQKTIVSSWFDRRHRQAENTFDPFIYLWIALNAALSARYGRLRDGQKVERFADELAPHWATWLEKDEQLLKAAHDLAERSPIYQEPPDNDGNRDRVDVTREDVRSVMSGIYAVRNNLFHGAKQFDAIRDHALVTTATELLERLFILSGLYEMAREPDGDLRDAISAETRGASSASP